jgi:hypothetical protein
MRQLGMYYLQKLCAEDHVEGTAGRKFRHGMFECWALLDGMFEGTNPACTKRRFIVDLRNKGKQEFWACKECRERFKCDEIADAGARSR